MPRPFAKFYINCSIFEVDNEVMLMDSVTHTLTTTIFSVVRIGRACLRLGAYTMKPVTRTLAISLRISFENKLPIHPLPLFKPKSVYYVH